MWLGLIQSVEGLHRTKRLTLPRVGEKSFPLKVFKLGHWLFPAFGFKLNHQLFLGLEPAGLQIGTPPLALRPSDSDRNYITGCPGSPACQLTLQILGLVSLHNWVSQFFLIVITYKHTHTHTHTHTQFLQNCA